MRAYCFRISVYTEDHGLFQAPNYSDTKVTGLRRKGPYRAPNSHCVPTGVHGHDFGLIARVVDTEALLLVLQEDNL